MSYDISQIRRSWCLNDHLDLSNHTHSSDFGKQKEMVRVVGSSHQGWVAGSQAESHCPRVQVRLCCLQSDAFIVFKEDDDGYIVMKMHFGDVSCFSKFCVQGCEVYLAGYEAIELL